MSFADIYFKRFKSKEKQINILPENDLFLTLVIPTFNENELCKSLQSIKDCALPQKSVEVIVVINSSEKTYTKIVKKNRDTYQNALNFAKNNSSKKLKFFILNYENLPYKFAGVGLARKIGMDEALRRYNFLNKPNGLIAGFDADALLQENYFIEIEKFFNENHNINGASIDFQHPIEGKIFDEIIYKNIINYELHLRYYVEALRFIKYPFAYHTIGSSFVVKADVYAKQGGMNRRKAGEDFYFLQKIIPLGYYGEINSTKVIPSPRISDRVPFGTGAAISKMIENSTNEYYTYSLNAFILLKDFFKLIPKFYKAFSYNDVPQIMRQFLEMNSFEKDYIKIKSNSPKINIFEKRFYDWFNAFRVIKFLNFAHEYFFERNEVKIEAIKLLEYYHRNILVIPNNEKDLLILYRKIQTKK